MQERARAIHTRIRCGAVSPAAMKGQEERGRGERGEEREGGRMPKCECRQLKRGHKFVRDTRARGKAARLLRAS